MMGSESSPGIIPRICKTLFYLIKRYNEEQGVRVDEISAEDRPFTVEASYLEIYNEVLLFSYLRCDLIYLHRKSEIYLTLLAKTSVSESIPRRGYLSRT
jgi:hypothetical protein